MSILHLVFGLKVKEFVIYLIIQEKKLCQLKLRSFSRCAAFYCVFSRFPELLVLFCLSGLSSFVFAAVYLKSRQYQFSSRRNDVVYIKNIIIYPSFIHSTFPIPFYELVSP